MNKIDPLTSELVQKRREFKTKYEDLEEAVLDRMDYVLRESMRILGYNVDWWDTQSEEAKYDSEFGSDNCMNGDTWYPNSWDVSPINKKNKDQIEPVTCFIDKFGEEWCLFDEQFPTRWLFEDFEEELTKGRAAFLEKQTMDAEKEKNKKEEEKAKKSLLKEQAKAKLSVEEQRALGL